MDNWETLYDGVNFLLVKTSYVDSIPDWVVPQIKRVYYSKGGSSVFLDKYWAIMGKHYEYRFYLLGQGGSSLIVQRKLRKGVK